MILIGMVCGALLIIDLIIAFILKMVGWSFKMCFKLLPFIIILGLVALFFL